MLFADFGTNPLISFIALMVATLWLFRAYLYFFRRDEWEKDKKEREERALRKKQEAVNIAGTLLKAYFNQRR